MAATRTKIPRTIDDVAFILCAVDVLMPNPKAVYPLCQQPPI
jgi:hypothetical protein